MPLSPSSIYLCIFGHGQSDRAVSVKAPHTPTKIVSEERRRRSCFVKEPKYDMQERNKSSFFGNPPNYSILIKK